MTDYKASAQGETINKVKRQPPKREKCVCHSSKRNNIQNMLRTQKIAKEQRI
jgi:hypothetical protein